MAGEPVNILSPIRGVFDAEDCTIEEAVSKLPIANIEDDAFLALMAAQSMKGLPTDVNEHHAAAIRMYTFQNNASPANSLFAVLNAALRSEDRTKIVVFFPYLKLLLTGLQVVPLTTTCQQNSF